MNYLEDNGDEIVFEHESLWEESGLISGLSLKKDVMHIFEEARKFALNNNKPYNGKDKIASLSDMYNRGYGNMYDLCMYQVYNLYHYNHTNSANILVAIVPASGEGIMSPMTCTQTEFKGRYIMMDSYGNHPGVYECKKPNLTYFIVYRALEMINNMHVNGDVKVYAWMYWDLTEFGQTYTEAVKKMIQTKPLVAFKMSETKRVSLDCIQNMITKEFVEDVVIEDLFIEAEDKKEEKPKEKKTSTAKKIPHTKKLYDCSYAKVEKVLSTPAGSAKYQRIIENFLGRNINKLITKGPVHKLVFGSADQKQIFDLFGTSAKEINDIVEPFLKSVNPHTDWKLITNNPVYLLIASACFYYHAHKKKKELDSAIIEMGVAIYWSIMVKYWPYGANEGIMNYTIDKLSGKFLIKQSKNLLDCLLKSGQNGFKFYGKEYDTYGMTDNVLISYIQRVHHDQNSMFKNIKAVYEVNRENNNYVVTRNDKYDDDTPIVDDVTNASTTVDIMVSKVTPPIVNNPINTQWCEAAGTAAQVSKSDVHMYISKIVVPSRNAEIKQFVECILHSFLYTDHYPVRKIKSQEFLAWSRSFIKKTNSKDPIIKTFCSILNKWGEEVGLFDRFAREGTRINYKKAIYFYFIFSIVSYA